MTFIEILFTGFFLGSLWTFAGCFICVMLADRWPALNSLLDKNLILSIIFIVLWPITAFIYGLKLYFTSSKQSVFNVR